MSRMRSENPSDSWTACPPGMLSQLAQREASRRSKSRALTVAAAAIGGAASVFLLLGSMGWIGQESLRPSIGSPLESGGGVVRVSYSCREAIDCRDRFLLGDASPEAQVAVREHLAHCAGCQAKFRRRAQELKVEYTVLVLPSSASSTFASR